MSINATLPELEGHDIFISVFLHTSINPNKLTPVSNDRLEVLGRIALKAAVTTILFGQKPLKTGPEIQVTIVKIYIDEKS